jgi:hypothetical protein
MRHPGESTAHIELAPRTHLLRVFALARAVAPPTSVKVELEVFKAGRRVNDIAITAPFHILGRNSETSTTAIEGDTVSRQHAAIFHNSDGKSFVRARHATLFAPPA